MILHKGNPVRVLNVDSRLRVDGKIALVTVPEGLGSIQVCESER